jgi:hypothetical protein
MPDLKVTDDSPQRVAYVNDNSPETSVYTLPRVAGSSGQVIVIDANGDCNFQNVSSIGGLGSIEFRALPYYDEAGTAGSNSPADLWDPTGKSITPEVYFNLSQVSYSATPTSNTWRYKNGWNGGLTFTGGTQNTGVTQPALEFATYDGTTLNPQVTGSFIYRDAGGTDYEFAFTVNWILIQEGAAGSDGAVGISARAVNLTATDQTIEYDTDGTNPDPSSVTITATAVNASESEDVYFEFFVNDENQDVSPAAAGDNSPFTNSFTLTSDATIGNPKKIEVQIREGSLSNPILARDQMTIFGLKQGSDAITISFTNDGHVLPTTSDGTVDYSNSGTDIEVFEGTNQLVYDEDSPHALSSYRVTAIGSNVDVDSSPTFDSEFLTSPLSLYSPEVGYVRRYGEVHNMSADSASIEFTITIRDSEGKERIFTRKQSLAKSLQGAEGSSGQGGRTVSLSAGDQIFEYNTAGQNPSPANTVITAQAFNTEESPIGDLFFQFFVDDQSQDSPADLTGDNSPDIATFTYTPRTDIGDMPDKIEVEIREGSANGPVIARDQFTVFGVQQGSDAITIAMTNEGHTVNTGPSGDSPSTYPGSGTQFNVLEGATLLEYDNSPAYDNGSFRISADANSNITIGTATTPNATTREYGDHSDMVNKSEKIVYQITVKRADSTEQTFTRTQSLSKSIDGAAGADGASTFSSFPHSTGAAQVGGSGLTFILNSTDGVPNSNAGEVYIKGTTFIDAAGTERTGLTEHYVATAYGEGVSGVFFLMYTNTAASTRFGGDENSPEVNGIAHQNIVGIRSNGSNGYVLVDNIQNDNVDDSPHANQIIDFQSTDCIVAAVEASATTGGITRIHSFLQGTEGGSTNIVFQRASSAPASPSPSAGVPSGWSDSPPAGTDLLWAVKGTKAVGASTFTWGTVFQVEGTAVAEVAIYIKASSASTPTGGSYNFTTNTLTAPASWSTSVPTLSADGDKVYLSVGLFTGSPEQTAATTTWSTPVIYAQRTDGATGDPGDDGNDGARKVNGILFWSDATVVGTATGGTSTTLTDTAIAQDLSVFDSSSNYRLLNTTDTTSGIITGSSNADNLTAGINFDAGEGYIIRPEPDIGTAAVYDFTDDSFDHLDARWSLTRPEVQVNKSYERYWEVAFSAAETLDGNGDGTGEGPITFGTPVPSIRFGVNIESDNYSAGVSGWQIQRDSGDAEFNNVTARGSLKGGKTGPRDYINYNSPLDSPLPHSETGSTLNTGFYLGPDDLPAGSGSFDFIIGDSTNQLRFDGSSGELDIRGAKFTVGSGDNQVTINSNQVQLGENFLLDYDSSGSKHRLIMSTASLIPGTSIPAASNYTEITNAGINHFSYTGPSLQFKTEISGSSITLLDIGYSRIILNDESLRYYEGTAPSDTLRWTIGDSSVGTTNAKVTGGLQITGAIIDSTGDDGTSGYVPTANGSGGWAWAAQTGSGGGGVSGSGTIGTMPIWTGSTTALGNSNISFSSDNMTVSASDSSAVLHTLENTDTSASSNITLRLSAGTTDVDLITTRNNSSTTNGYFELKGTANAAGGAYYSFDSHTIRSSGGSTYATFDSAGDFAVDTDTLFVDASADRVGINDSTPSYSLDVNGTGRFTGTLTTSGGIDGLTLSNGISGVNFNISGVNQLSINDPGEGIVFGGGTTTVTLAAIDDSTDSIMNFDNATELRRDGNKVWDAGNDGTGSGLDADTVDGLHSDQVKIKDTRADGDVTPTNFSDNIASFSFTDDITGSSNTWDSLITMKGWQSSTYRAWQLISNSSTSGNTDTSLYFRSGIGSSWGSLEKVATLIKGTTNVALGFNALDSETSAGGLTAIGHNALTGNNSAGHATQGTLNTGVGYEVLKDSAIGYYNTGVGYQALLSVDAGFSNVAVGVMALRFDSAGTTSGYENVGVGFQTGYSLTTGYRNTIMGHMSGYAMTSAYENVAIGYDSGGDITDGIRNVTIGTQAGRVITTGDYNTLIGRAAGYDQTTASHNTAVGASAGENMTSGGNVYVGSSSGVNATSGVNTAVGYQTLEQCTTGSLNTAIGYRAMDTLTTASNHTAVGTYAGLGSDPSTDAGNVWVGYDAGNGPVGTCTGIANIGIGYQSMTSHTTSSAVICVGYQSGLYLQTANDSVGIGRNTLQGESSRLVTGAINVAVGPYAQQYAYTGTGNTSMGRMALRGVSGTGVTGNYNVALGYEAGQDVTSGSYNVISGYRAGYNISSGGTNTAIGTEAMFTATTAEANVAVGRQALYALTDGLNNVAVGRNSLDSTTTGDYNVAVGYQALDDNVTGGAKTAVGYQALQNDTGASLSTAVGYQALGGQTTGLYNVAIGHSAGGSVATNGDNVFVGTTTGIATTGASNTMVGFQAGYDQTSGSNNLLLGRFAGRSSSPSGTITTGSNIVCLGDNSITSIFCADTTISSSDSRDKTDIENFSAGLDFIKKLRPVTYRWDKRSNYLTKDNDDLLSITPDGTHKESRQHLGFLAQEVEQIEKEFGYSESKDSQLVVNTNEDDTAMGIKYERLVPVLVNAIKELSAEVEKLKSQLNQS